jgi:DegV family protein with EDD domain
MWIVTDSAADLTPEDIARWGIHVMPLYINFDTEEVAASDIAADAFYDRLRAMVPKVPTTSQPAVGAFLELYQKAKAAGEAVLSVHVSSGLSGTAQTAMSAARQMPDASITVIDTMTLSAAQRYQVLAAAAGIQAGLSVDDVRQRLDAIREQSETAFTLETLEYLQRGGRIGRVQALAGTLLQIKPIIHVEKSDGKYSTLGRGRTIAGNIASIITHFESLYGREQPLWLTVVHGQFAEKAQQMEAMMREKLNVAKLDTLRISPVLGVHTGPGIVGASAVPLALFEGLPLH